MRKHRSLGEMISTATFLGCGVFIFYTAWNCLTRVNSYAPISGFPQLCFVFWVGSGLPSQILSRDGGVTDG